MVDEPDEPQEWTLSGDSASGESGERDRVAFRETGERRLWSIWL